MAIVGGGHNGLSAACYLAFEGKKVVVIEALDLMSLRVHPMMPIELGLDKHAFSQVEMTPGYVYLHPDGNSLVFWRDPQKRRIEQKLTIAMDVSDRCDVMAHGSVVFDGTPNQLRQNTDIRKEWLEV